MRAAFQGRRERRLPRGIHSLHALRPRLSRSAGRTQLLWPTPAKLPRKRQYRQAPTSIGQRSLPVNPSCSKERAGGARPGTARRAALDDALREIEKASRAQHPVAARLLAAAGPRAPAGGREPEASRRRGALRSPGGRPFGHPRRADAGAAVGQRPPQRGRRRRRGRRSRRTDVSGNGAGEIADEDDEEAETRSPKTSATSSTRIGPTRRKSTSMTRAQPAASGSSTPQAPARRSPPSA